MNFKKWVKHIQTADYNDERTVRGHTLITLGHRGTYLVCKMLTGLLSWSIIDKNLPMSMAPNALSTCWQLELM